MYLPVYFNSQFFRIGDVMGKRNTDFEGLQNPEGYH